MTRRPLVSALAAAVGAALLTTTAGLPAAALRADVPAEQLAGFCLAALTPAGTASGPDVVVELVWTALTADPASSADSA